METIKLIQPPITDQGMTVMQALKGRFSSRHFTDQPLSLETMSALLWALDGVNRPSGRRTAPCAMSLYPLVYVVFLKQGVYTYDPVAFELRPLAQGDYMADSGSQDYVGSAALNLLVYADYSRIVNEDPAIERALYDARVPTCALDAGMALENVAIYAAANNLNFVPRVMVNTRNLGKLIPELDDLQFFCAASIGHRPPR